MIRSCAFVIVPVTVALGATQDAIQHMAAIRDHANAWARMEPLANYSEHTACPSTASTLTFLRPPVRPPRFGCLVHSRMLPLSIMRRRFVKTSAVLTSARGDARCAFGFARCAAAVERPAVAYGPGALRWPTSRLPGSCQRRRDRTSTGGQRWIPQPCLGHTECSHAPCASQLGPKKGLTAALYFRGGETDRRSSSPAVAKPKGRKRRILLDVIDDVATAVTPIATPILQTAGHLLRLGFGLSLTFYGMAFRTFAFHIIAFRISGMKKVQKAFQSISSNYVKARQSIREATEAAETMVELTSRDELKAAKERMIEEKKLLMANGILSDDEIAYFMAKYRKDLNRILNEQERAKSARSSIFSVRQSVSAAGARQSLGGLYNGLVTGFTASTIPAAGKLTLGLHVGNLLKTHILDLFGAFLDPIGHRLDLDAYFEKEDIPYMGKANTMGSRENLMLNILSYGVVLIFFRIHPSVALKVAMVYYGARVVTDYVVMLLEPVRKRLGLMTLKHTPTSALIHAAITVAGLYFHRGKLSQRIFTRPHITDVGPGVIGLLEPYVRLAVRSSKILHEFDVTAVEFVQDPLEAVGSLGANIANMP